MKIGKMNKPFNPSSGTPRDGADMPDGFYEEGGVNNSDAMSEAKKFVRGAGVEGVNVETGWGDKTKYTKEYDKA